MILPLRCVHGARAWSVAESGNGDAIFAGRRHPWWLLRLISMAVIDSTRNSAV